MNGQMDPIKNIAIAVHPSSQEAMRVAGELNDYLQKRWKLIPFLARINDPLLQSKVAKGSFDLMITLGGDGTMLRAGHLCAPVGVPLLGINLGRFGFLMQLGREDWKNNLTRLLESKSV
jgi:NAD+ kinase